ncbi:AAA family ATPase [Rhodoferax sp. 4810]|uniref:AAA family ATPase n=1 Tax=Thiospirillum jenense TaxID=1653858 RepID=A0A839HD12_9GAMM|nr:AAA family ATPase [Thiospirillum jenense]MBB1074222.1 AAA family ATPase [Rhodoferax jenense]MBB1125296.1 AAA family ATPase [Thiospirillum jenense]
MNANALVPTNPDDFEKFIARLCQQAGYDVIMPPANTKGYDIEIIKGELCIALQVKNHKAKCNISQIQKFQNYLELPIASRFCSGWFISASGFSKQAITHIETERPTNLELVTCDNHELIWNYPQTAANQAIEDAPLEEIERPLKYIGVFTCKGGVGKTTVAAHLAGAFALMGHDVILVDLDPDKNLRKLFLQDPTDEEGDASLYVPPKTKGQEGATITVLNHDQWDERHYKDTKIVICDCSPVLSENPRSLVARFNYCIIPTTLNPLGIAKHADVITRTFKHIRALNPEAELFAVINSYDTSKDVEKRNEILLSHLKRHIEQYAATDSKCKFIHPDAAKIRYSTALLYWGYHIIEGSKPQLAFREIAGRSYPRTDFLQLAEYLENHTDIDQLREDH